MVLIDKDVNYSFLSSFADDTRIGCPIVSPGDYKKLQSDLDSVYKWASTNNMKLHSDKFDAIRYGPSKYESNCNTQYLSDKGIAII